MQYPGTPPRGGVGWLALFGRHFPFLGASPHQAACWSATSPKRADRPTRPPVLVRFAGRSPPDLGSREMSARELDTPTLTPRQRRRLIPYPYRNDPIRGEEQRAATDGGAANHSAAILRCRPVMRE